KNFGEIFQFNCSLNVNYRNVLPPNALHFKPEFWILMLHLTHFFSRYAATKNAAVNIKILIV
ncbi:hypothetical protein BpHYR1_039445, partial [Brachionus plicatilis]